MGNTSLSARPSKQEQTRSNVLPIDKDFQQWLEMLESSYTFVWCDQSIGTQNNVNDETNTITELARVVNKNRQLVHTFNELKTCREFINHLSHVCLIISGSFGEEFVPSIHNLEQIHSIYIFCIDKAKHSLWALNYPKIRGVFTDIREICESLKSTMIPRSTTADYDRTEFDVISSDNHSSTDNKYELRLIYSKLTRMILLNMNSSSQGIQDMISYCRSEYTGDAQVQAFNELERTYSQFCAIWWFTKTLLFQGILNCALRTHDLYALCSLHRFVKDLDIHLTQLHHKQRSSTEPLNLFFGQLLASGDFEKLKTNHGGLMCINEFLLANPEKSIAALFLKQQIASKSAGNKIPVLFQIHIDRRVLSNVPYANIGSVSQFVHENEHLISMASIYRIEKIEKYQDIASTWFVHLTLIGKNDVQYNNLTQHIQQEQLAQVINLAELGYTIKTRLHQFRSANKLFKHALSKKKHEFRTIILHYNMAIIYDALTDYEKSLEQYRSAFLLARDNIPTCQQKDDLCLVSLYSNMALTYEQADQFTHALEHAFRALRIILNTPNTSLLRKELESSCYYNLGLIHDQEGKFSDAQSFYEQALRIRQEYLSIGHTDITVLQRLITLLSNRQSGSD